MPTTSVLIDMFDVGEMSNTELIQHIEKLQRIIKEYETAVKQLTIHLPNLNEHV